MVDWDVHHGNGTQDLFWNDPSVLYVSTHQWPCYPGTGSAAEVGGPAALGTTVNVPLPPGATGDVLREAYDRIVALLAGRDNIREVIAFPKATSGADPLTGAPAAVDEAQLRELGLRLR